LTFLCSLYFFFSSAFPSIAIDSSASDQQEECTNACVAISSLCVLFADALLCFGSCAAMSQSAAAASIASFVDILVDDTLEHTFLFLSFEDMRSVVLVSRKWRNIIADMPTIDAAGRSLAFRSEYQQTRWEKRIIITSPLLRYVTELSMKSLSQQNMHVLAEILPHLRRLRCRPSPPPWLDEPFPWAESLEVVDLCFESLMYMRTVEVNDDVEDDRVESIEASIPTIIEAISHLPSLTWLSLSSMGPLGGNVSLAPLVRLEALHILSLKLMFDDGQNVRWSFGDSRWRQIPGPNFITEVRSLFKLAHLEMEIPAAVLELLLQPAPPDSTLQWKMLPSAWSQGKFYYYPNDGVTPAVVALLPAALPNLRRFEVDRCSSEVADINFLAQLASLEELFSAPEETRVSSTLRCDALLRTLTIPLHKLVTCKLKDSALSAEELGVLLSFMPHLDNLVLIRSSRLHSLTFLNSVSREISKLTMEDCAPQHALSGLECLSRLPSLMLLALRNSFARIPEHEAVLRPLLPLRAELIYTHV
jgi:hypothetical protein